MKPNGFEGAVVEVGVLLKPYDGADVKGLTGFDVEFALG